MLRRLFRRRIPADHEATIERLVQSDDPVVRKQYAQRLKDELAVLLDSAGDAAQMRLFGMETRLSDQIQQQLGSTNTMIGDLHVGIGGLQRQITELGNMFSSHGERLTSAESDIADLRAYRDELPSPRRRDLIDELHQNTADIATITRRLNQMEAQQQRTLGTTEQHNDASNPAGPRDT